jgi:hypothetical protein
MTSRSINFAPDNKQETKKKSTTALMFDRWNIRTVTPGFSNDLQEINDSCKTVVIDMELSRLQMDIDALRETRLPGSGSIKRIFPSSGGDNQRGNPVNLQHGTDFLGAS